jgi:hypothetical protein
MRGLKWSLVAIGAALVLPATSEAQVRAGPEYEYDEYGTAVSEYYGMPVDRVPRWIDPDELPLVYLLAREAGVSPQIVIALREQGWSWVDITYELGVDPYLYVERLPYSTGYWRRYSSWELRYLTDRHIIDYVNLIFWADYHRRPVTQVIVIRQRVPSWRHYVRYYTPPRTVARGVYVQRTPTRSTRDVVPRHAVPRDESQRRAVERDGRSTNTRATAPTRPSTGVRPTDGVRRDPAPTNGGTARPAQGVGRDPSPSRGTAVPSSRSTAVPSRGTAVPSSRGTAVPSRGTAVPSSRSTAAPSRSTAVPSSRSTAAPPRSTAVPSSRSTAAPSRGTAVPSSRCRLCRRGAPRRRRGARRCRHRGAPRRHRAARRCRHRGAPRRHRGAQRRHRGAQRQVASPVLPAAAPHRRGVAAPAAARVRRPDGPAAEAAPPRSTPSSARSKRYGMVVWHDVTDGRVPLGHRSFAVCVACLVTWR